MGKLPAMVGLILSIGITACAAPRPLTVEEQEAWMARQQCRQEATNFNPFFPGPDNPAWSEDYVMCMRSLGISNVAISRLWP